MTWENVKGTLCLAMCGLQQCAAILLLLAIPGLASASPPRPKLVVLDIELTGDLGGPDFAAEHAARLEKESAILRDQLEQSGLYQVLDNTPALPLISKLKSQQAYWHDCNGCDLEVGRQLGADQVLVTWVDRVSNLILSLTYEFHSVATGQIIGRGSYDFRGDNDAAWTHTLKFMVRDFKEGRQQR
jgi:Protein of unknown function (DUF2380)